MRALVAFYSQSGNTGLFAKIIADTFRAADIECDIELLKPNEKASPGKSALTFRNEPIDLSRYDLLLLGGPIWAFTMCPPTLAWLLQQKPFKHAPKAAAFTTQGLFFKSWGGTQGLHAVNTLMGEQGASIVEGEIVSCLFTTPRRSMTTAALRLRQRMIGR